MENLYKAFRRLSNFFNLENIRKAVLNPGKAIYFLKIYLLKDKEESETIREIVDSFFSNEPRINIFLKEMYASKAYNQRYSSGRAGSVDVTSLYLLTRTLKPKSVVETGVASGRSSALILQGLHDNNNGSLYSIELPKFYPADKQPDDPSLLINVEGSIEATGFIPEGKEPGWLIPKFLRNRWKLILGVSQEKLPELLNELGEIELFYHDSEHTYKNMLFEFKTVWPHIKRGGFLISDDINRNMAFDDFTKELYPQKIKIYRNSVGIIQKI